MTQPDPPPSRYLTFGRAILFLYWIALAIASHWPRMDLQRVGIHNDMLPFGVDKWLHAFAYAGLAWLALLAKPLGKKWRSPALATFTLLVAYSIADELAQTWAPGRTVTITDWYASSIGLLAGTFFWWIGGILSNHDPQDTNFVAHTRIVSALTLLSRVFGLCRDWALAWVFGFSMIMDAFVIAFMAPNLFRRLFGEGALSAAFIPQYTKLREKFPLDAQRLAMTVCILLAIITIALLIICEIGLLSLNTLGSFTERGHITIKLAAMTFPFMPFVCITALLAAMLQVHKKFGPPAAAPIILNIAIITAAFIGISLVEDPEAAMYLVAAAVVAAGIFQVIWQYHILAKDNIVPANLSAWRTQVHLKKSLRIALARDQSQNNDNMHTGLRAMLLQWGPTVLGLGILQINTLLDALIAFFFSGDPGQKLPFANVQYPMQTGDVAVLGATSRLYEFPLGVFGIAVATAIFPALSAVADSKKQFTSLLQQGLRLTMFIGLPATVGLILVRDPLTQAIYGQGGQLTAQDASRVSWVLLGYAPAIWAYSMNQILTRAFYAQQNPITPMKIAVSMVTLNFALNLTLIWPLGAAGLAWSTATCASLQCLILILKIRRYTDNPISKTVWQSWSRIALITALMAVTVYPTLTIFDLTNLTRTTAVQALALATLTGALTVFIAAKILKLHELKWLLSRKGFTEEK